MWKGCQQPKATFLIRIHWYQVIQKYIPSEERTYLLERSVCRKRAKKFPWQETQEQEKPKILYFPSILKPTHLQAPPGIPWHWPRLTLPLGCDLRCGDSILRLDNHRAWECGVVPLELSGVLMKAPCARQHRIPCSAAAFIFLSPLNSAAQSIQELRCHNFCSFARICFKQRRANRAEHWEIHGSQDEYPTFLHSFHQDPMGLKSSVRKYHHEKLNRYLTADLERFSSQRHR